MAGVLLEVGRLVLVSLVKVDGKRRRVVNIILRLHVMFEVSFYIFVKVCVVHCLGFLS